MSPKAAYQKFCVTAKPMIFQTPQWLDVVAGADNWKVLLAKQGDIVVGAMPYVIKPKWGFKQITLPALTPYLGPIIRAPHDLSEKNKPTFTTKITLQLLNQLPKTDRFITQCDFDLKNWLPFAWNNFKQTTRYSYLLSTSASLEVLHQNFKPNIKKDIKRCEDLHVFKAEDTNSLYSITYKESLRKGIKIHFTANLLNNLSQKIGDDFNVYHAVYNSKVIAAIAIAYDSRYAHYILGGVTLEYRNSGAMSKLLYMAIKDAKTRNIDFNFEGSMHQGIGQYFKSFGGTLTPYHQITKVSHPILKHFNHFSF